MTIIHLSERTLGMARAGRKRSKTAVRDAKGKSRGDPADVVRATVMEQRARLCVVAGLPARIGSPHGRDDNRTITNPLSG
jgi:hypothetical protein